jgi:hypothetical protein
MHTILLIVAPLSFGLLCSWLLDSQPCKRRCSTPLLFGAFALTVGSAALSPSLRDTRMSDLVPAMRTVAAATVLGVLVLTLSFVAGFLLPEQPLSNRNSIVLEICIRDLTISAPVAMFGLPMLSYPERACHAPVSIPGAALSFSQHLRARRQATCARASLSLALSPQGWVSWPLS